MLKKRRGFSLNEGGGVNFDNPPFRGSRWVNPEAREGGILFLITLYAILFLNF